MRARDIHSNSDFAGLYRGIELDIQSLVRAGRSSPNFLHLRSSEAQGNRSFLAVAMISTIATGILNRAPSLAPSDAISASTITTSNSL
jgi:hypothetical protein